MERIARRVHRRMPALAPPAHTSTKEPSSLALVAWSYPVQSKCFAVACPESFWERNEWARWSDGGDILEGRLLSRTVHAVLSGLHLPIRQPLYLGPLPQ